MTPFNTARLYIRPYQESDFHFVYLLQSDEEIMRYIRLATKDAEVIRERTKTWLKYAAENPGYGVCILENMEDKSLVGYGVLRHVEFQPGRDIEIGYTTTKACWGKGYATEATLGLIQCANETLGIHEFVAYTDEANIASNRVLEKCGFRRIGMERVYEADCLRWEK